MNPAPWIAAGLPAGGDAAAAVAPDAAYPAPAVFAACGPFGPESFAA